MSLEKELENRSGSVCELCGSTNELSAYEVTSSPVSGADANVFVCSTCKDQLVGKEELNINHWRCLNDSMWSTVPAVQVTAWRILNRIKAEGWPQDLLDMLYLEDDVLQWAKSSKENVESSDDVIVHKDSNGAVLNVGDTVVLIKDLNVKGGGFTAKRGTAVRNIGLVHDNPEQIEGRVNGQLIVLLTQYVKKSN